jgi:hypothetical protein
MTEFLSTDWTSCLQVFRIERERRIGTKVEVEIAYGITSYPCEHAEAMSF